MIGVVSLIACRPRTCYSIGRVLDIGVGRFSIRLRNVYKLVEVDFASDIIRFVASLKPGPQLIKPRILEVGVFTDELHQLQQPGFVY